MKTVLACAVLAAAFLAVGCSADSSDSSPSGPADATASSGPKYVTVDCGNSVTLKLVRIPAGSFVMGSPPGESGRDDDEGPQREVTISKAFYMGATEVTQEQYQAVMGKNPSKYRGKNNPVEQVTWSDASMFCQLLSDKTKKAVRLPTEAEWEYACRAGTTTRYSFGDSDGTPGLFAWHKGNSGGRTHPVGRRKANPWVRCPTKDGRSAGSDHATWFPVVS